MDRDDLKKIVSDKLAQGAKQISDDLVMLGFTNIEAGTILLTVLVQIIPELEEDLKPYIGVLASSVFLDALEQHGL